MCTFFYVCFLPWLYLDMLLILILILLLLLLRVILFFIRSSWCEIVLILMIEYIFLFIHLILTIF